MTEKPNDFDRFAESIRATATETGALVIGALLDIPDRLGVPQVDLGLDEMLAVIRHVRPSLVYLIESCFELESEVYDTNESDGDGDGEPDNSERHPALEKLIRKWRKHDGKSCVALAGFATDGILHIASARPAWRDDFANELEVVNDEIASQVDDRRKCLSKLDSQEVREKAEILVKHASFSAGRVSFEKRAFLAEHLFPGLDSDQISAVTRRAENLDWLNKSGFQT